MIEGLNASESSLTTSYENMLTIYLKREKLEMTNNVEKVKIL